MRDEAERLNARTPERRSADSLGVVAICGLGLIGGSLGMALREAGAAEAVIGWNRRREVLQSALERGAIDRAEAEIEAAVASADIVVLGVPVKVVDSLLESAARAAKPGAVFTDVGSTKARIVARAEAVVGGRFVGGHPMAGSEESGIGAAAADLFRKAAWPLTPTAQTDPAALSRIERMVQAVGARPMLCDAREHDRWVASLSHLPHVLAYGLAQTAAQQVAPEGRALAAGSFRDGTRVARSDPRFWTDILMDNRIAALESLAAFQEWAQRVETALRAEDPASLMELLSGAHMARKDFP